MDNDDILNLRKGRFPKILDLSPLSDEQIEEILSAIPPPGGAGKAAIQTAHEENLRLFRTQLEDCRIVQGISLQSVEKYFKEKFTETEPVLNEILEALKKFPLQGSGQAFLNNPHFPSFQKFIEDLKVRHPQVAELSRWLNNSAAYGLQGIDLDDFREEIIEIVIKSYVAVGTPVGVFIGTAHGAVITQISLDSHRSVGAEAGKPRAGFFAIRHILTGSKNMVNVQTTVFFKDEEYHEKNPSHTLHEVLHTGSAEYFFRNRYLMVQTTVRDLLQDKPSILNRREIEALGLPALLQKHEMIYGPGRFPPGNYPMRYVLQLDLDNYRCFVRNLKMKDIVDAIEGTDFRQGKEKGTTDELFLRCIWRSQKEAKIYVLVNETHPSLAGENQVQMNLRDNIQPSVLSVRVKGIPDIEDMTIKEVETSSIVDDISIDSEGKVVSIYTSEKLTRNLGPSLMDLYSLLKTVGFQMVQGTPNYEKLSVEIQNEFGFSSKSRYKEMIKKFTETLEERFTQVQKKKEGEKDKTIPHKTIYYLELSGENMNYFYWRGDIDEFRTFPSNAHKVALMFDITAARNVLYMEFQKMFSGLGANIDPRHSALQFYGLTYLGHVATLSFSGHKLHKRPANNATSDQPLRNFSYGGFFGTSEDISGITGMVYTGQISQHIGSGAVQTSNQVEVQPPVGPPASNILSEKEKNKAFSMSEKDDLPLPPLLTDLAKFFACPDFSQYKPKKLSITYKESSVSKPGSVIPSGIVIPKGQGKGKGLASALDKFGGLRAKIPGPGPDLRTKSGFRSGGGGGTGGDQSQTKIVLLSQLTLSEASSLVKISPPLRKEEFEDRDKAFDLYWKWKKVQRTVNILLEKYDPDLQKKQTEKFISLLETYLLSRQEKVLAEGLQEGGFNTRASDVLHLLDMKIMDLPPENLDDFYQWFDDGKSRTIVRFRDFNLELSNGLRKIVLSLLEKQGKEKTLQTLLRYQALLPGRNQFSAPSLLSSLLLEMGFVNEGFGSPLNWRLQSSSGKKCSLFPDEGDGDFFSQELQPGQKWYLHPPPIPSLLNRLSDHLLTHPQTIVYLVLPYDYYTSYLQKLLHHPHLRWSKRMRSGSFVYEDFNGYQVTDQNDLIILYLDPVSEEGSGIPFSSKQLRRHQEAWAGHLPLPLIDSNTLPKIEEVVRPKSQSLLAPVFRSVGKEKTVLGSNFGTKVESSLAKGQFKLLDFGPGGFASSSSSPPS